jgi:Ca-activated chloride channel family protein
MVRLERLFGWLGCVLFAIATTQEAQHRLPDWVRDPAYWWRTPDQRGADLYAEGDFVAASLQFRAPGWRGVACYRAENYPCAAQAFARSGMDPAVEHFNLGNVDARRGQLSRALIHYDAALDARPGWTIVQDNRRLVLELIADRSRRPQPPEPTGGGPNLDPDDIVIDERGGQGKPGQIQIEKIDPDSLAQQWLKQIRNDPAEFLRLRFASEQAARRTEQDGTRR